METIYTEIMRQVNKGNSVFLITKLCNHMQVEKRLELIAPENLMGSESTGEKWFVEPMANQDRLIICGGGHISMALADFASKTGFRVVVIDDRSDFANEKRFPMAAQVICDDYLHAFSTLHVTKNDYVVIVTRGHMYDGVCLRYIVDHEMPYYVGMIGSRKRVREQFRLFVSQGVDEERLNQVATPIGLDIGAVSPQEIAVAILGELIQKKRKTVSLQLQTDLNVSVIRELASCKEPAAVVTIMNAKGSTPIGKGAKMLVGKQGILAGTIGGGSVEMDAVCRAEKLIGSGSYEHYIFDMDADVAKEEGMACGGTVEILIEDLA